MSRPTWCGTAGGYSNHKCRCADCRAAWNAQHKRWRDARRRIANPPAHVHGTNGGYSNYSCRCQPCQEARREYKRDLYARKAGSGA